MFVTISDYVADLRAATPSNAAELAVPDQDALRQTLDNMASAMATILNRQVSGAAQHLRALAASPALSTPTGYLQQRAQNVELLRNRLISAQVQGVERKQRRYVELTAKLDAMSPLKVLTRGYAMAQTDSGQVIRSVAQVSKGDKISVNVSDGIIDAVVEDRKGNGR